MEKAAKTKPAANVDEYLHALPAKVGLIVKKVRQTIKAAAPAAEEVISYQMPAYKYKGMLVYFAAFKNHIGFYPTPGGIEAFRKELSVYQVAKGSVKFPLDKPIPFGLIDKIVKFRVKENEERVSVKKNSKPETKKITTG